MPLPFSKNQVDKLGGRLAAAETPADEDLEMLQEVVLCHAAAVSAVRQRLDSLEFDLAGGVSIAGRAKTTQTIIDKIRRSRTRLSSMEDLAGVRLVADMTLTQQVRVATLVRRMFADGGPVRVIDRRTDPRSGYRAVHLIIRFDSVAVEIQIRTRYQDLWANIFEKTADRVGREIRYGELPRQIDGEDLNEEDLARLDGLVRDLVKISDNLFVVELARNGRPELLPPGFDLVALESALQETLANVTRLVA